MSERVLIDVADQVAHVRLNRPEKRNGLDFAMFAAIIAAGERLAADRSVRAVVLSGEGKAFCAGLDFPAFMAATPETRAELLERGAASPANVAQRIAWVWREVPVPVIAAVHGAAFGGGFQLALGADLRCVAPDAQLAVMEIHYGLVPDMGASRTLLRLVRPDVAKELTFSGRVFSGEEALRLGVATFLAADPVADALARAREIASRSPHAVRAAKALYDRTVDLDDAAALLYETELQVALLGSANQIEATMARLQKRSPSFQDPE